jgi:hypothetical protein
MVTPDLMSEEDIAKLIIPDDLPDEPTFKAYIEAKIYDKEGHVIDYRRQPMRSLTQYFLAFLSIALMGTYSGYSSTTAQNLLTSVLGMPSSQTSNGSADIGYSWSIQLGSGTQSFSPTLNSLAAPIANGTGTGQLTYGNTTVSYSGLTIYVSVTVTNYSSTTINVTEIGLIGSIILESETSSNTYASTSFTYLFSYDTFSPAVTLPPGAIATFQITLSFSG